MLIQCHCLIIRAHIPILGTVWGNPRRAELYPLWCTVLCRGHLLSYASLCFHLSCTATLRFTGEPDFKGGDNKPTSAGSIKLKEVTEPVCAAMSSAEACIPIQKRERCSQHRAHAVCSVLRAACTGGQGRLQKDPSWNTARKDPRSVHEWPVPLR